MNQKSKFTEMLMAFCVCTTCITILEGVLGVLFYPNELLNYKAFFASPVFAFFSVLLGAVNMTKKELSMKQILLRRVLHLLLIEGMVFGLNYISGNIFPTVVSIVLALGIALIFIAVYVILWINDQRNAQLFNQKLKEYQSAHSL